MRELIVKKCMSCGATVNVLKDCKCHGCGIVCCDNPMKVMKANDSDGAAEKHKPTYTVDGDYIVVSVNHVMDNDHYIEWICLVTDSTEEYVYFNPEDKPTAKFNKVAGGKIYSYCNKHGLWVEDIK